MSNSSDPKSDPAVHQQHERHMLAHVEKLLQDGRLKLETVDGKKNIAAMNANVNRIDKGVELKRIMAEMGKPSRELESQMPSGKFLDVTFSKTRWWVLKSNQARFTFVSQSPIRALLAGESPAPMNLAELKRITGEIPPPIGKVPWTIVVTSTSGFTQDAKDYVRSGIKYTTILASPNETGGWTVTAAKYAQPLAALFDPEVELAKRGRIRDEIDASQVELLSGGVSTQQLSKKTGLPEQLIESELKYYAKQNPGLTAKRLDGSMILYREGPAPISGAALAGGVGMAFIDKVRTLFARKGETEKKIAFLAERRAALSLQRDRSYEDLSALEGKESELRQQFKDTTADLTRRRITSQLLQLQKDIIRRQQLQSVLNQQINVVSTHLHNLELQQQGKSANLPDSEEMATDAAAAEEVLAELEASSELADSVGSNMASGLSAEEQALYEQLIEEGKPAEPQTEHSQGSTPISQSAPPPIPSNTTTQPQRQRANPEPG
jgi:hypothetical protein